EEAVIVSRQVAEHQRDLFLPAHLAEDPVAQSRRLALADRCAAAQVRQAERRDTVAAERGAEQRIQGGILRDRQKLTGAKRPGSGCEIAAEHADVAEIRFLHRDIPLTYR